MGDMVNNYGWHLVDRHWILGIRQPGEDNVSDPQAEIQKREGVWCWRMIGDDIWHARDSFNEAVASANEAFWRRSS